MPKKINWDAIRDTFISSERDLTYSELASMFGVSRQGVELKASPKAENWQALREAFRLTNSPTSTVEAHATKPSPSQPSSIVANHHDPDALEASSFPAKQRHLQRQDINNILVDAITQSSNALKDLEPRSFEKTATVLISLLKAYAELNPPTPEEWAFVAINLNLSAETMLETLNKVCKNGGI